MNISIKPSEFREAFSLSVPVMFGYVPLGIAFGVLFSELPYDWFYAGLMGLIVFAGAAQFLLVGLLANHTDLLSIFIAVFLLNARHMVYGLALLSQLSLKGWRRWYLIFALTDESYSVMSSVQGDEPRRDTVRFWIALLNHGYWALGCFLGGFLGSQIDVPLTGAEFALPALFAVLAIEQFKVIRSWSMFLTSVAIALIAIWLSPTNMLLTSVLMALALLVLVKRGERWNLPRIF